MVSHPLTSSFSTFLRQTFLRLGNTATIALKNQEF